MVTLSRWGCGLSLKQRRVMGFDIPCLEGGSGEPLIIPDHPGFGAASRNAQADCHIEAQAARVMGFADAMGLRRMHMGGNSMGGFIAAECAGRHPERIASLWLIGSAGVPGTGKTELVRQFKATGEWPLLVHEPSDFDRMDGPCRHGAHSVPAICSQVGAGAQRCRRLRVAPTHRAASTWRVAAASQAS